ncbi:MAG: hypothetical protein NVV63_18465 [Opitutus sp.]|nr:hypothetical protein [Opitutus sp.]
MSKILLPIFVCAALLLGGCATPVSQADRASIKRVAVVSDLSPEIKFHSMGVLPVIQKEHSSQAEAFSVLDTAEGVVVQSLAAKGYVVTPVSDELRATAKRLIEARFAEGQLTGLSLFAKDYDAVVFIVSQRNQGLYGGETGFGGIEVIPSKIFGLKSVLIGCNTGLFVYSTAPAKRIGVDVEARGVREVRGIEWKERWDELSPADQQKVISDLKATIEAALKPKIEKLL